MNIIRIGRNVTIIAFLLSLLFHGSTIFYIFTQKTQKNLLTEIEHAKQSREELQQQQKNNPWVETRARADNFGAPVFFRDEPSFAEDSENTTANTMEDKPKEQNITNTQEDSSEMETLPEEKDIPTTEQSSLDIAHKPMEKNDVILNTAAQLKPKVTPTKKRTKNPPSPRLRRTSKKTTQSNNYTPAQTTPKPSITLAQLAQGFLHQRKEQSGSYGISMLGMKLGIPSDEQMKYERYLQKLSWCIQNSFRINDRQQPPLSQHTTVHVFFALDRDGTLKQLSLKKSSGNMYIDQFVLFIFRDASSSFPPVPSYLTDDPFSITCIVS